MDRRTMLNRLEEEGFKVNTRYDYIEKCHIISIRKDDVFVVCKYEGYDDPQEFYDYITRRWKNEWISRNYRPRRGSMLEVARMAAKSGIAYGSSTYMPYDPIKKVIFNPPATIVFWTDGTKTVVKAQNDDLFDYEKGLTMAIAKKAFGNKGNYFEHIKKWTKDQPLIIDLTETNEINRMGNLANCAYERLIRAVDNKKLTKSDLMSIINDTVFFLEQILDD